MRITYCWGASRIRLQITTLKHIKPVLNIKMASESGKNDTNVLNIKMASESGKNDTDVLNIKMASESGKNDTKTYSALVVDDSALIRSIAQKLLERRGFKTKMVENGQEAIDIFTAGNSFDVVLMDMEMPVKDGIQATKELRAMGVKSLIYGVTASQSETDIQAFTEAGLSECFEKPLNFVKIDRILKRLKE